MPCQPSPRELADAVVNQDAIFALQRHDVGDGAERDEIEPAAQIEIRQRRRLQQRVAKLENDSDAAEIAELAIARAFGFTSAMQSGRSAFGS